jgi:hypothetical protein
MRPGPGIVKKVVLAERADEAGAVCPARAFAVKQ